MFIVLSGRYFQSGSVMKKFDKQFILTAFWVPTILTPLVAKSSSVGSWSYSAMVFICIVITVGVLFSENKK